MSAPIWIRYITLCDAQSDKYYEAQVSQRIDGSFWLIKRWGRNPDTGGGQTKEETYPTANRATIAGQEIIERKLNEGYTQQTWPFGVEAIPDLRDRTAIEEWLRT